MRAFRFLFLLKALVAKFVKVEIDAIWSDQQKRMRNTILPQALNLCTNGSLANYVKQISAIIWRNKMVERKIP